MHAASSVELHRVQWGFCAWCTATHRRFLQNGGIVRESGARRVRVGEGGLAAYSVTVVKVGWPRMNPDPHSEGLMAGSEDCGALVSSLQKLLPRH